MKERLACFLVPVLTALVLLYQILASLQIAVTNHGMLTVIGTTLAIAVAAGLLAALGPSVVRVGVLAACTLLFLDVTFHLSGVFDHLQPAGRKRLSRDTQRLADIQRIKSGLDQYVARYGALPRPTDYGEGTGPESFWQDMWDVSSSDGNHNAVAFLDFLVDGGIMPAVPVDPMNDARTNDPRSGNQYVYFLVPPTYKYAGGTCDARPNRWHYMVAIANLEDEPSRPPIRARGSGCPCLWKDKPNYFQQQFDYVLCGTFDATPEVVARAAKARADRIEAAAAAATRVYVPQDKQRVADLLKIKQGLEKYLAEIGPLPAPGEYGEAEKSNPGFWQGYWDVSSEDGDGDGQKFLDFLTESGVMPSVPVDPDNEPGARDPRGGKQYVYYLGSGNETFEGGTCAKGKDKWVYLLGITDLRSEVARPPRRIAGSGCDCLWSNKPNFFQQHFDYVVCGTFEATPESRARAAAMLAQREAEAAVERTAAAAQVYAPDDRRRVDDLLEIQRGLQTYLKTVGPLPTPRSYGEAEKSKDSGFWPHSWDVSAEDGDGDGKMFLDFLVEKGIMPAVPVDPDNERAADGDPRHGTQYVYFVAPAGDKYQGGSCVAGKKEWVYMLGITDLKSEVIRPPKKISGSGCECLWRDQPNYFQQHFDYVLCGTFAQ